MTASKTVSLKTAIKAVFFIWLGLCFVIAAATAIGWVMYAAIAMLTGCHYLASWIGFATGALCIFGAATTALWWSDGESDED